MDSITSHCLLALADLEKQLVVKLLPSGVDSVRIRLFMARHHDELLNSLMKLLVPARDSEVENLSKAEFDEAYAEEMAETSWGLTGPLKIGADLLARLQELINQGDPLSIYVDLGDGGEFEMVEVLPQANRLIVTIESDIKIVIPNRDARSLLNRIPLIDKKLEGGSIMVVSNSQDSFSEPSRGRVK